MLKSYEFTLDSLNQLSEIYEKDCLLHKFKADIKDLTYLKTYSIDDPQTLEVDDAISYESINGKDILWVHISNPAIYIDIDSPLDQEARKRASTLYLSDSTTFMFPEDFILKILSLKSKGENITLSISVEISEQGDIEAYSICLAKISNIFRLSYEDVDEILDIQPKEENELLIINKLLRARNSQRRKDINFKFEGVEGRIKSLNDKLSIYYITKTNSRLLIEEAMILMGHLISKYAIKESIVVPFRCQDPFNFIGSDKQKHYSINNFLIKQNIPRTYISVIPSNHFGLGVDSYTNCTSPIRRYIDLIAIFQITSHLVKASTMDEDKIISLVKQYEPTYYQNINIVKEDNFICCNKFISSNFNCTLESIFLCWISKVNRIALVYIKEYCFEHKFKLKGKINYELGEILHLYQCGYSSEYNQILEMTAK